MTRRKVTGPPSSERIVVPAGKNSSSASATISPSSSGSSRSKGGRAARKRATSPRPSASMPILLTTAQRAGQGDRGLEESRQLARRILEAARRGLDAEDRGQASGPVEHRGGDRVDVDLALAEDHSVAPV